MKKIYKKEGGFVQIILVILVAIAFLAYFNVDVGGIGANILNVFESVFNILKVAVMQYLVPMGVYLWTSFVGLFQ